MDLHIFHFFFTISFNFLCRVFTNCNEICIYRFIIRVSNLFLVTLDYFLKNSNYFKFPFIFFAVSFHFFRINQVVTIVSLNCLEQFKLHVFNRLIFLMILFYLAWIWHTQYKHVYSITLSMYYIYNCRFRFILICLKLSRFKILSDIIRRVLNIYASVKVS